MSRPIALVCHICGREYGTKSLAIHVKACEKKWENQENLKPPKQRRPCPQAPKGFNDLVSKDKITRNDISKFNAQSYDAYVEEALIQCEYCGRRFNPRSLIPHQKACKTSPMIRKPYVNKGPLGRAGYEDEPVGARSHQRETGGFEGPTQNGDLIPCRRCGRKFLADRVGKHERVCKAERVDVNIGRNKTDSRFEKTQPSKTKGGFGSQKKPKWKIQHEELQNAMKMMRQMKAVQARGGKLSDLPPPPPSNYDHYVECRYCGRKYAADVAERHIPKCANIINKPGGIKPSRIQEKYIPGTGAGMNKSYTGFGQSSIYEPQQASKGMGNNYSSYNNGNYNDPYGREPSRSPIRSGGVSNTNKSPMKGSNFNSHSSNMNYRNNEPNQGYGNGNSKNSYERPTSNYGNSNKNAPSNGYQSKQAPNDRSSNNRGPPSFGDNMYATSNSNYGGYTKPNSKPSYNNNDYGPPSSGQYGQSFNPNYGFAVQGSSSANRNNPNYGMTSQYANQPQNRSQMTLSPSKNTLTKPPTTTNRPKTNKYW